MSRTLLFVGPTITPEEIHRVIADVEILPPVAAGDLLKLDLATGDLIAIIDGYYYQTASVRHKEILSLLGRGIHVWGAASMGALRAVELAPFGMRGFGQIFDAYRQGIIEGDDEVAVLHASRDMDYKNQTEALVNIRYACQCAVKEKYLSQEGYRIILEIAESLPFYERRYPFVLEEAVKKGLLQQEADALQMYVRQAQPDLKKADALELLRQLKLFTREPIATTDDWNETTLLRLWKGRAQGISVGEDQWISDYDILTAYQLFGDDYCKVHFHTLLKTLAQIAARDIEVSSSDTQNEEDEEHFLSVEEKAYLKEKGGHDASSEQVLVAVVAEYLARKYQFRKTQDLPESANKWLRIEERTVSRAEQLAHLGVRLWNVARGFEWRDLVISALKKSSTYLALAKLVYEVQMYNEAIGGQLTDFGVIEWFREKWGIPENEMEIEIRDRGFTSLRQFIYLAHPYYLFDKYADTV